MLWSTQPDIVFDMGAPAQNHGTSAAWAAYQRALTANADIVMEFHGGFDALQSTLAARVVLAAAAHLGKLDEWPWGADAGPLPASPP